MNLRTYRPELPPDTIYRPHTLLERLCRETPPPAPKRTFRHAPKDPADVAAAAAAYAANPSGMNAEDWQAAKSALRRHYPTPPTP